MRRFTAATALVHRREAYGIVVIPQDFGCCGALTHHMGKEGTAMAQARAAIGAFLAADAEAPAPSPAASTSASPTESETAAAAPQPARALRMVPDLPAHESEHDGDLRPVVDSLLAEMRDGLPATGPAGRPAEPVPGPGDCAGGHAA